MKRVYRVRGGIEIRIKELSDVAIDRTNCSRFRANVLRLLLAAAAYVEDRLGHALRSSTLRLELIKIGAQVIASAAGWCCAFRSPSRSTRDGSESRARAVSHLADPVPAVWRVSSDHPGRSLDRETRAESLAGGFSTDKTASCRHGAGPDDARKQTSQESPPGGIHE
jgi:hypothetical protein